MDLAGLRPELRLSASLSVSPGEGGPAARAHAARVWQTLRMPLEDVMRDQAELEKADRAVLALRRELYAARQEARTQRERAEQAERLRRPVLIGAGVAVALFGTAWVIQRRQLVALREAMLAVPDSAVGSALVSAPASVGPDHEEPEPARRPPR